MNNFDETKWNGLSESEVYAEKEPLINSTVKKQFPNRKEFCKTHMIELEDLYQLGSIGLLNAIRNYNPSLDAKFDTYAYNCITWEIQTRSKFESLRNINTSSYEIANIQSGDREINLESGTMTLFDLIPVSQTQETENICINNVLFDEVVEFLKNDKDVSEDMLFIILQKTKGYSNIEIAKMMGVHKNCINQRFKSKKIDRVKDRLKKFLASNGEV